MKVSYILDKMGSFGSLVAALSCPGCFPALGSLGAAIGLSFLSQYEGFLFSKLIPALALLALATNGLAWYRYRVALRGALSVAGPVAVLAALFGFWQYDWSIYLFYAGLALMLFTSILDIVRPALRPQCHA